MAGDVSKWLHELLHGMKEKNVSFVGNTFEQVIILIIMDIMLVVITMLVLVLCVCLFAIKRILSMFLIMD